MTSTVVSPTNTFQADLLKFVRPQLVPTAIARGIGNNSPRIVFGSEPTALHPTHLVPMYSDERDLLRTMGSSVSEGEYTLDDLPSGLVTDWKRLDQFIHQQTVGELLTRYKPLFNGNKECLDEAGKAENLFGSLKLGQLIGSGKPRTFETAEVLAPLLLFAGDYGSADADVERSLVFGAYLGAGILFGDLQRDSNYDWKGYDEKAMASLRLAVNAVDQSTFTFMAPMLYDVVAFFERMGKDHDFKYSGIAAKLWAAKPDIVTAAGDAALHGLFCMSRSMWHGLHDLKTLSGQNRLYAGYLRNRGELTDAGWALVRSGWALSELNGPGAEVSAELSAATALFREAGNYALEVEAAEFALNAKRVAG